MNKKILGFLLIIGLALVFAFASNSLYAGTKVEDSFKMKAKEYKKHKKGIVTFSHKKHSTDYKAECGECHHDKDGKPLNDLKMGDDVQRCIECHKETKKKKDEKISKKEKIKKYYENAIHANCKGCHKDHNKEKGYKKENPKAAPVSCKTCHPKTAK
ncbi:MAG: cytochrome C [Desulfobacteraceae bacterium 4572_130]|nr:MAG: cytochrome C [Desulfobacteraceae bacterium 4572_130]